ncbi:MAG: sarcosine oxidase subunit delta [Usitatibacter sp.]
MLIIRCPWCGDRDHTEFNYGGDARVVRPAPDAPLADWVDYVYMRDNPRGAHEEYWHHVQGCRQWLRVGRDTMTHTIFRVLPAATRFVER